MWRLKSNKIFSMPHAESAVSRAIKLHEIESKKVFEEAHLAGPHQVSTRADSEISHFFSVFCILHFTRCTIKSFIAILSKDSKGSCQESVQLGWSSKLSNFRWSSDYKQKSVIFMVTGWKMLHNSLVDRSSLPICGRHLFL